MGQHRQTAEEAHQNLCELLDWQFAERNDQARRKPRKEDTASMRSVPWKSWLPSYRVSNFTPFRVN